MRRQEQQAKDGPEKRGPPGLRYCAEHERQREQRRAHGLEVAARYLTREQINTQQNE